MEDICRGIPSTIPHQRVLGGKKAPKSKEISIMVKSKILKKRVENEIEVGYNSCKW